MWFFCLIIFKITFSENCPMCVFIKIGAKLINVYAAILRGYCMLKYL